MNDETTTTNYSNSHGCCCCCVTNIRQVLLASTRQEMFRKVRENSRRGAIVAAENWLLLVSCFLFLAIGLSRQVATADGASHESFARPEQSSSPISSSSSGLSGRLLVKRAHHSLPQHHWRPLGDMGDNSEAGISHQQTQEYLGSRRNHKRIKHKLRSAEAPKERSESAQPQVPEQLPIVVSSSDNSYVSASPIVFDAQTTSKIISETTTTPIVDNEPPQNRHHWTHSSGSISSISSSRSRRLLTNHANTNELDESNENHKSSQWHTLWPTDFTDKTSDQVDKMSSTSDTPTTATTTQRTIQLANSPSEDILLQVDRDEVSFDDTVKSFTWLTLNFLFFLLCFPNSYSFTSVLTSGPKPRIEVQNKTSHYYQHRRVDRIWGSIHQLYLCDKLQRLPCGMLDY